MTADCISALLQLAVQLGFNLMGCMQGRLHNDTAVVVLAQGMSVSDVQRHSQHDAAWRMGLVGYVMIRAALQDCLWDSNPNHAKGMSVSTQSLKLC